jgi:transcriptional regulator with AAA-type ATPase domain
VARKGPREPSPRTSWGKVRPGQAVADRVKVWILDPRGPGAAEFIAEARNAAKRAGLHAEPVRSIGAVRLPPAVVLCAIPPRDPEPRPGRRVVQLTSPVGIAQEAHRALLEHLWDRYKSPPEPWALRHWPVVPQETVLPASMVPALWDAYARTIRPPKPHQRFRSVLIVGRSGSGKEALAKFLCRAWHEARAAEPGASAAPPPSARELTEAVHRLATRYVLASLDLAAASSTSNDAAYRAAQKTLAVLGPALERLGELGKQEPAADPLGGQALEAFCRAIVEGEPELIERRLKETGARAAPPSKAAGERHAGRGRHAAISFPELPESSVVSYLLGWRKGAFTNVRDVHQGPFEEAGAGGSVHLDEVGKTDRTAGATLLRLLSTGLVRPLAATAPVPLAPQFVVATMTLDDEQVLKRTLPDLWNRLSEIRIETESLRKADLEAVRSMARSLGRSLHQAHDVDFTPDFLEALLGRCRSPAANVELREFHRIITRAVDSASDRPEATPNLWVTISDLPPESTNAAAAANDPICGAILGAAPRELEQRVSEALGDLTRPPRVAALKALALEKEQAVSVYEAVKAVAGPEIGAALFDRTVKTMENWRGAGAAGRGAG